MGNEGTHRFDENALAVGAPRNKPNVVMKGALEMQRITTKSGHIFESDYIPNSRDACFPRFAGSVGSELIHNGAGSSAHKPNL